MIEKYIFNRATFNLSHNFPESHFLHNTPREKKNKILYKPKREITRRKVFVENLEIVRLLAQLNVDPFVRDRHFDLTALDYAVGSRLSVPVAKCILDNYPEEDVKRLVQVIGVLILVVECKLSKVLN